jgi:hypothetical protein
VATKISVRPGIKIFNPPEILINWRSLWNIIFLNLETAKLGNFIKKLVAKVAGVALQTNKEKGARFDSPGYWD